MDFIISFFLIICAIYVIVAVLARKSERNSQAIHSTNIFI